MFWAFEYTRHPLPLTHATAQAGPIGKCPLYGWVYVADTVFAAPASALSTSPVFTTYRAGAWPALSKSRICCHISPEPASFGIAAHVTFSWAAAWIASYSCFATTPMKLR